MLKFRTVGITGEITERVVENLIRRMVELQLRSPVEPIKLVIDSGGGSSVPALWLHDFISQVLTAPVHATVIGVCASAATFVLLACPVRRSLPHARFVIHSGTRRASITIDNTSETAAEQLLADIRQHKATVTRFYSRKLKKTPAEIEQLVARGDQHFNEDMTAEEAFQLGLITEIVMGNAGIFPLPTKA